MPRDREVARKLELERQRHRESAWASREASDSGLPLDAGPDTQTREGRVCWRSRWLFFSLATNDLGPTVVAAATLTLLAVVLCGVGRLSLVAYSRDIRTGSCKILAKHMQRIRAPIDFWRAALSVSLVEDASRPSPAPALPPGAPTTCWSDGIPHSCEVPPPRAPVAMLATAYSTLKGAFDTNEQRQQALLDQHHVGETAACFFRYVGSQDRNVPSVQVVLSVTQALHAGHRGTRSAPSPWLVVSQFGVIVAALAFWALVTAKCSLGQWQREVPSQDVGLSLLSSHTTSSIVEQT